MIRISTAWGYQQSLNNMLSAESSEAEAQNQVSTGLAINEPSDNPTGAAQVVSINHIMSENTNYSSSINSANTRLSTESSTLSSATSLLDSVNDLTLSAMNGAMSQTDLNNIATELTQYRNQLVTLANTTDGNGNALFAGTSNTTTPFTLNSSTGEVTYNGNNQTAYSSAGSGLQVANGDPGSSVFMDIPAGNGSFVASAGASNSGTLVVGANSVTDTAAYSAASPVNDTITFGSDGSYTVTDANGNPVTDSNGNPITGTYTDGQSISFDGMSVTMSGTPSSGDTVNIQSDNASNQQDVFTTLNNIISALQSGGSSTQLNNTLNKQLESLSNALGSVSTASVSVGSRLDVLQQQSSNYSDLNVTYKTALTNVQGVDETAAISQLSLESTALQAAQEAFAKVQGTSLFDYLQS